VRSTNVAEIGIDEAGRLLVRPQGETFEHIYRCAMEVHWDQDLACLFVPKPRKWSYVDWYRQIVAAVRAEYGRDLVVSGNTRWTNVPADLRRTIEAIGD
jgi:Integron Cassette Protein Hfx_Cass5